MQPVDIYSYPRGRIRISPDRRQPAWQPHGSSERRALLWHFPDGRSPWPLRPAFQGGFASLIHAFMVLESMVGRLHTRWPRGRESVGMEEFVSLKRNPSQCTTCPTLPLQRYAPHTAVNRPAGDAGCAGCWPDQRHHGESGPHRQPFPRTGERGLKRSPAATFLPVYQFDETGWRVRWWRCSTYARPCGCALTAPTGSRDI